MCLTLPFRVTETDGLTALVEKGGERRRVNLLLMAEPVAVGDYVLIQVGDFAVEKVAEADALEAMALLDELTRHG
ncbi:MAG TPA: HypC/HybG/HupF family hydrogenase formation chaperone [Azospirillaceae bacterium]|nr:HypC/HybG/HupF family hydrogenase formation chaperone [Azospirillaceae bacterium]